jgi:hypothetical protein
MRLKLIIAALVFSAAVAPMETVAASKATQIAQAAPTPKPTPNAFVWSGYFRGYDFTRQNASNNVGEQYSPAKYNYNAVNQQTFEAGLSLHGAYNFSGFQVGGTYLLADPFNNCDLVIDQTKGLPCISHVPPDTNPDGTLPSYQLATLYEAYASYNDNGIYAKIGNQVINTPWTPNSDSRIKPDAFQGADASYTWGPWTIEGMDMLRFESRVSSWFTQSTLLTGYPPTGNSGLPGNNTPPGNVKFASNDPFGFIKTDGFYLGRVAYATHNLTGELDYYSISDIANIVWATAKYTFPVYLKPFIAAQFGDETNTGLSAIGKIDSQVTGVQAGVNLLPQMQLVAGYDDMPWKSQLVTLPSGSSCSSSTHLLKIGSPADGSYTFPYFIPNNAPQCVPGAAAGTATVFYGGWASPYSDSYATDPLFTTQMTQGVVDRHVAGSSWKAALVFTSANHQFVGTISTAYYNAGNAGGAEGSNENNIDAMYYFRAVRPGRPYKGLLLRYRYGERFFNNTLIYGGLPVFKYNRAQLEYDF